MTESAPEQVIPAALGGLFDDSIVRERLMRALCECLVEKGFSDCVVADIVKRAKVSRRSFYEQFSDRGDCLLAVCDHCTSVARELIDAAADPTLPWESQVANAIDSYIAFLTLAPKLTHAMHFEIYGLGDRGQAFHQSVDHAFSTQVVELADRAAAAGAEIRRPSYPTAAALIGAIFQLLQAVEAVPQRITIDDARSAAIELVLDATRPRT